MKRKPFSLKMPSGYSVGIHAAAILLNIFGFLMILSANMTSTADRASLTMVALKEITFIIISYLVMVWVARNFSFKAFHKHYGKILLGVGSLLAITLLFPSVNGAQAWIRLGPITIQPSEVKSISFKTEICTLEAGDFFTYFGFVNQGVPLKNQSDYIEIKID